MLNGVKAHAPEIHHEIKPACIMPVDTEHPHEPAAARFVGFIDKFSRRSVAQSLTGFDLLDPSFHRCRQQNFQYVFVIGQKLVSQMAMVHEVLLPVAHSDLAEGGLQSDPVGLEILHKPAPPVRFSLDDFAELRFRNAVSQARFHQHLPTDATTTERLRQCPGECFTAARCALIYRNNGHGTSSCDSDYAFDFCRRTARRLRTNTSAYGLILSVACWRRKYAAITAAASKFPISTDGHARALKIGSASTNAAPTKPNSKITNSRRMPNPTWTSCSASASNLAAIPPIAQKTNP